MTDLDSLMTAIDDFAANLKAAVRSAYDRGYRDGRNAVAAEFVSRIDKLKEFLPDPGALHEPEIAPIGVLKDVDAKFLAPRAPRGSVEPKVLTALKMSIKGKKPAEIALETGVPENSVRGMLNRMRKDGRVFKVGDVWRPAGPVVQPDGSTLEVKPDGTLVSGDNPKQRRAEDMFS